MQFPVQIILLYFLLKIVTSEDAKETCEIKKHHAYDIWLRKQKNAMYKPLFDAEMYTTDDCYAL